MYSVSESYRAKMLDQVQTHRLTGTIDGVSFSEADVIGVSWKNQCSQKNVLIGSVNIGVFKCTFLRDLLNRGDYFGKKIVITDGLLLGRDENDDPDWEDVPVGEFYIAEALWTAAGIEATAYDVMSKLDKDLNVDQTSGKLYSFCLFIAQETGTVFGMTEQECDALPNGTEIIAPYEENDIQTYRDLLSALAQMIGGFAYADRDGSWKLKPFDDEPVLTIPKNRRISGTEFSDFETLYDAISYTDVKEKMVRVVGDAAGVIMKLGSQPFLQYGTPAAIEQRATAIVNQIKKMKYNPFKAAFLPALIALDLGDVISMTDDYAEETSTGAIMSASWTYNKQFSAQCFGDNPALASAQSKTAKNISGLVNSTTQNEVTYYQYNNIERIDIQPDTEVTIATLAFTAAQTTTVKILHEFIFDILRNLGDSSSYELRYYLDDELQIYKPRESLSAIMGSVELPDEELDVEFNSVSASITRDFFYILKDVAPNQRHVWKVKILAHGVSEMFVDARNAHVVLEGQRLYGENYFDGYVEITEEIGRVSLTGMDTENNLNENVTFELIQNAMIDASDSVSLYEIKPVGLKSVTEAMHMFIETLNLKRITEDGYQRITEDGGRRISQ